MDEAGALGISHARIRALAGRVNPPEKDHRRVAHDGSAGGLIAFSSAPPDVCVLQDLDDDGSDGEWLPATAKFSAEPLHATRDDGGGCQRASAYERPRAARRQSRRCAVAAAENGAAVAATMRQQLRPKQRS